MANRKVTIQIDTKANTSGATQAAQAMDKLADSSKKAATDTTAAGKAAATGGRMFGQAGLQIQDAAVQIGAGTSKLTILSQQLPQLLGAFGPAGAIAGAVIAVGAVATQIFMKMGDDTMSAEEKAKKLAETIQKIGEAAEKAVKDNIDFGKQKIEDATTAAQNMAEELNNVAQNQIILNDSIAESLRKVNDAERELAELRGESSDKLKIQSEQAAAEATRRQEVLSKSLAEEQLKLDLAKDALDIAEKDLAAREKQKAAGLEDLATSSLALEVAKQRLETLKQTAKETESVSITTDGKTSSYSIPTQEALGARKELASGSSINEIERLKATVEEMQKSLISTGELTKEVESAKRNVTDVEQELRTTFADVDTAVKDLTNKAQADDVKATVKDQTEKSKLAAEEIGSMIEGLAGSSESEKAALETLKTNLSNKQIDLDEVASTAAALNTLGPLLTNAIDGNSKKVSQLITIMGTMQAQSLQLQSRIDALQKRMSTPSPSK